MKNSGQRNRVSAAPSDLQAAACAPEEDDARQHRLDTGAGGTVRPRPLSPERIGEISVALAYAALDTGADPEAILAAWARLGAAMPLALDLCASSIAARPTLTAEVAERVQRFMAEARAADHREDA